MTINGTDNKKWNGTQNSGEITINKWEEEMSRNEMTTTNAQLYISCCAVCGSTRHQHQSTSRRKHIHQLNSKDSLTHHDMQHWILHEFENRRFDKLQIHNKFTAIYRREEHCIHSKTRAYALRQSNCQRIFVLYTIFDFLFISQNHRNRKTNSLNS